MRSLPILSRPSKPLYPTASELYRGRGCIAPWALGLPEEHETNEYAERGQRRHTFAAKLAESLRGSVALNNWELCVAGAPDEDRDILENVYASLSIDACGANMSYWLVEQGIRYRPGIPDVAEFVEREPGQRFEGWFGMTLDLGYVRHDGRVVVADWKFGRKDQCEPAEENCQLMLCLLGLCTALGITASSDNVVIGTIELRFVTEDGIDVDAEDVTWGELCAFADEVGALAERIDNGRDVEPKRNHGCGRCKSRKQCPSWTQLEYALFIEAEENATGLLSGPPRDAEHAREYRDGIEALKRAKEDLEERYKAFLVQHPDGVPLGLGMREVARKIERQNLITTEAAQAAIRAKYGNGAFASRPSLGRIRAVEKAKFQRPSKSDWSKRKEALDEELREAGLLLPPSVHTRAVVQQIKKDKHGKDAWVDYRVDDEEEGED